MLFIHSAAERSVFAKRVLFLYFVHICCYPILLKDVMDFREHFHEFCFWMFEQ